MKRREETHPGTMWDPAFIWKTMTEMFAHVEEMDDLRIAQSALTKKNSEAGRPPKRYEAIVTAMKCEDVFVPQHQVPRETQD